MNGHKCGIPTDEEKRTMVQELEEKEKEIEEDLKKRYGHRWREISSLAVRRE